jgi:pimeloyl-ACP methyl ester carboxylesterase
VIDRFTDGNVHLVGCSQGGRVAIDYALAHPLLTRETPCADATGALSSIGVPALVVWGSLDFPHIQERSRRRRSIWRLGHSSSARFQGRGRRNEALPSCPPRPWTLPFRPAAVAGTLGPFRRAETRPMGGQR